MKMDMQIMRERKVERFGVSVNDMLKKEKVMIRRYCIPVLAFMLFFMGVAGAQEFPIMDMVANNLIQKYQNATCEQLWQQKNEPKTTQQQEFIQILRGNQQMRTAFINKVSPTIVNKMFECGMIP